jgi:hypothetical protein
VGAVTADQRASSAGPAPTAVAEELPLIATILPPTSPMRNVSRSSTA